MVVKLLAQLRDLLADAFEFCVRLLVAGELPQLLDVLFQALDLALTIHLRCRAFGFVFGFHHITRSIDCSPNDSRTAAISSGQARTRCSTCSVAIAPSGKKRSRDSGLDPR